MDGSLHTAKFRQVLRASALATASLIWAYPWFKFNKFLARTVSPRFRYLLKLDKSWNEIVYHRAKKRMSRYESGERLDDFFQALMHDKSGQPHNLDWGEIVAEVNIM